MALKDDPKVQELVAKAVAKAQKDSAKNAVAAVKATVVELLDGEEDKATIKTIKATQKAVLDGLKEAAANTAE